MPAAARPRVPAALLFLAVHLASAALFLLDRAPGSAAAVTGFPLDDAWIHLVYARSAAALDFFAYNPGVPEAGMSSPLWVLLLAPLFWLPGLGTHGLVLLVKAAGVVLAWAASVAGYRLVLALTGRRSAAVLLGLLLALDPSLSFAKVSGMEVSLTGALLLGALLLLARGRRRAAGLALALLVLARPEGAVVVLLAGAALLLARRGAAELAAVLLPPAAAAALWSAYCLAATGRPLPNTFYVKHESMGLLRRFADLGDLLGPFLLDLPWFALGTGYVLYALGARELLRGETGRRDAGRERGARILASWRGGSSRSAVALLVVVVPPVFLVAIAWAHDLQQWKPYYWNRYAQPVLPVLLVPVAVGAQALAARALAALRRGQRGRTAALACGGAAVLLGPALAVLPGKLVLEAHRHAWNCRNIGELQVSVGHWIARNSVPGDRVASIDAGAVRFFGGRRTLDLVGLNEHRLGSVPLPRLLEEFQPRYLVVSPVWYRLARGVWPQLQSLDLVREMQVVHRAEAPYFTICDCDNQLFVFETGRERGSEGATEPGSEGATQGRGTATKASGAKRSERRERTPNPKKR